MDEHGSVFDWNTNRYLQHGEHKTSVKLNQNDLSHSGKILYRSEYIFTTELPLKIAPNM